MSVTGGGILIPQTYPSLCTHLQGTHLLGTHPWVLTTCVLTPWILIPWTYPTPWALTPRHTPKKWPGTRDLIRFQPFTSIHFLYSTKGNTDADICKFKGSAVQISHTGCWIALSHTITSFIHWYAPLVLSWLSQFHKKGLIKGKLYFVRFVY